MLSNMTTEHTQNDDDFLSSEPNYKTPGNPAFLNTHQKTTGTDFSRNNHNSTLTSGYSKADRQNGQHEVSIEEQSNITGH